MMNEKINQENWEVRSEGTALYHYWNGNVKLCNTVKHNILQAAPPSGEYGKTEHCTACYSLISDKLI